MPYLHSTTLRTPHLLQNALLTLYYTPYTPLTSICPTLCTPHLLQHALLTIYYTPYTPPHHDALYMHRNKNLPLMANADEQVFAHFLCPLCRCIQVLRACVYQ